MRNLQSTISTIVSNIGNTILGVGIVRQGKQLIVRGEVLRSLCANSLDALAFYATELIAVASRPWPSVMKPCLRTAVCLATVEQTTRRHHTVFHNTMCHRSVRQRLGS